MKLGNIILDVDGTLWDTTDIVADSWTRAIRDCGIDHVEVTGEDLKKLFGKTMDVIAQAILPDCTKEKQKEVMEVCCRYEHEDLVKIHVRFFTRKYVRRLWNCLERRMCLL